MSNCIGLSTPSEASLKNAKACSPPRLDKTGAVVRPSKVCTAAPHCSTDNRQSRRVSGVIGVHAVAVLPPVPVAEVPPLPLEFPAVPPEVPALPLEFPAVPPEVPALPLDEPAVPPEVPALPLDEPAVPG